jgi:hypothetical protein
LAAVSVLLVCVVVLAPAGAASPVPTAPATTITTSSDVSLTTPAGGVSGGASPGSGAGAVSVPSQQTPVGPGTPGAAVTLGGTGSTTGGPPSGRPSAGPPSDGRSGDGAMTGRSSGLSGVAVSSGSVGAASTSARKSMSTISRPPFGVSQTGPELSIGAGPLKGGLTVSVPARRGGRHDHWWSVAAGLVVLALVTVWLSWRYRVLDAVRSIRPSEGAVDKPVGQSGRPVRPSVVADLTDRAPEVPISVRQVASQALAELSKSF